MATRPVRRHRAGAAGPRAAAMLLHRSRGPGADVGESAAPGAFASSSRGHGHAVTSQLHAAAGLPLAAGR